MARALSLSIFAAVLLSAAVTSSAYPKSGQPAAAGGKITGAESKRSAKVPKGDELPAHMGDAFLPARVAGARPEQVVNRPSLIDYNPVANPAATVISPDKMARFTVLTSRLIRMEYAKTAGVFEDHSTLAMMNRNLPVPAFASNINSGVLTIKTKDIMLTYTLGQPFAPSSLSVVSTNPSSAFKSWNYGDAFPGNLLGTIRGLDMQNNTPLNCTQNVYTDDNGEFNHCEWGVVSRDGWAVYEDGHNYILNNMDWWVGADSNNPNLRQCNAGMVGTDVLSSARSTAYPLGTTASSAADCCNKCMGASDCTAWVFEDDGSGNCWPLADWVGTQDSSSRVFGQVGTSASGAQQNADAVDSYGFFHGHDYFGALADFVQVSGKTIMVPKYASGVWWSRWYDLNHFDVMKVVDDYESRRIPLDVFVIDMDWHTKDNWSGFTFDTHLFPYPADTMNYLMAQGLPVTLNLHDASGVNNWDAMFPQLAQYLGYPSSATVVPFNIVNATVAYAVEDIVLGDLLYNKNVSFWWIDWQQGGTAGGMTGYKQNPTLWLNHIRSTSRHRVGDNKRGIVLARWGGLGGHRYQVGFSGDVLQLTWGNMAYQPYFSATAVNVGHGFWSHDIEGPATDLEMFVRWVQIGAYSGTMRSHDRGMSTGGCANDNPFDCSVVEVWNSPNTNFPVTFMEAHRLVLQSRALLLPYIYNGHRAAFDTGVGLVRPCYYHWPELDAAYGMDGNGNNVQYMFGPSILFSPVVQPGDSSQIAMGPGTATKTTWLPPGAWVDANSGVITTVAANDVNHQITKSYAIYEVPLWYVAGSVIPYVPLRSLPTSVGNAARQYTFLGFKIIPGSNSGSTNVYEDDGETTAYLTDNSYAWTTCTYNSSGTQTVVTIATNGSYPELPTQRAYQLRFLNSAPIASVTINGANVPYNRYGRVASKGALPPSSQFYWDFSVHPYGMGAVVDMINVPTGSPVTVVVNFAVAMPAGQMSGVYGAITHAIWAKANLDIERSTPGSNSDDPAYTSVLSSVGSALEYLAGTDANGFVSTVQTVANLLGNATAEVSGMTSQRKTYSLALLQSAMM